MYKLASVRKCKRKCSIKGVSVDILHDYIYNV